MAKLNENFLNIDNYLFSMVAEKAKDFKKRNPDKKVINLGIGDVTLPLAKSVISAMHNAVDDLSKKDTFQGYGPEHGYDFLIDKIVEFEYRKRNVDIKPEEVYVSAGSKGDIAGILDILSLDNIVRYSKPSLSCLCKC